MIIQTHNPSSDEMWQYIEGMLLPYDLIPIKKELTQNQISDSYTDLMAVEDLFTILAHILFLREQVDKLRQEHKM